MRKFHFPLSLVAVVGGLFACLSLNSCSSDDAIVDDTVTDGVQTRKGPYFVAVKSANGTEYIMQTNSLTTGNLNIKDNIMELPQTEYTWIFKDHIAVGLVYQQQFSGLGYGLQWSSNDLPFQKLGEFRIDTRYSNYGFFNGQLLTSVGGQVSPDGSRNDGASFVFWNLSDQGISIDHTQTLWTEDITGNGQQVTFSSIVDCGDGTFLSAMVQSDFHQTGTGDGSSIGTVLYPDSVWVARLDANLNVLKVYGDDRLSYAAGQYRSQVLQEVFRADDGTVYVFSNATNAATSRKAGALRMLQGAEGFDADYYFNIEEPANGYKFRRVWYITGHTFLLEIYNEKSYTTVSPGHQYALVDMEKMSFKWVDGLPAKNLITSGAETGGVPCYADGVIYLPITQYGQDAAIYQIDPVTAVATKGITLVGVYEVRSIGKLD